MARINYVKKFRGTKKTSDGTLSCSSCGDKIRKGDPYRWWSNRTHRGGSGMRRNRCMKAECTPKPWEYQTTSPHIAALMMAADSASTALGEVDRSASCEDVSAEIEGVVTDTAAEGVREAAEGYRESAQNIEDGFGHSTYVSEELTEKADALEGQADDLGGFTLNTPPPDELDEETASDEEREEFEQAKDQWIDDAIEEAQEAVDTGTESY
jgi:hypothetical protein